MNIVELKKRFFSFIWRLGGMVAVALLAFISSNLELLELSPAIIAIIGLVVGEITKIINSRLQLGKRLLGVLSGK